MMSASSQKFRAAIVDFYLLYGHRRPLWYSLGSAAWVRQRCKFQKLQCPFLCFMRQLVHTSNLFATLIFCLRSNFLKEGHINRKRWITSSQQHDVSFNTPSGIFKYLLFEIERVPIRCMMPLVILVMKMLLVKFFLAFDLSSLVLLL